jgi:hypothetical protein
VKQSLSLKTDSLKVNVTGLDTVRPLANDSIQQEGDTSVAGMLRLFRFTDEENDELNNTNQPFISSSTYFKQHQLEVKSSSPQLFNKIAPDWFTVVLFFLIAGITTVKVFYQNIFRQLVEAVYSFAVTNQVVRDENLLVQRASVLLNVIFYCSSGLFFYWISVRYNWNHPILNEGLLRFLFFAFVTAVFFTVKMLLLKLIGTVFNLDKPVAVFYFFHFFNQQLIRSSASADYFIYGIFIGREFDKLHISGDRNPCSGIYFFIVQGFFDFPYCARLFFVLFNFILLHP